MISHTNRRTPALIIWGIAMMAIILLAGSLSPLDLYSTKRLQPEFVSRPADDAKSDSKVNYLLIIFMVLSAMIILLSILSIIYLMFSPKTRQEVLFQVFCLLLYCLLFSLIIRNLLYIPEHPIITLPFLALQEGGAQRITFNPNPSIYLVWAVNLGLALLVVLILSRMLHRYVGEAIMITLLFFLWMVKLIIHSIPQLVPWLLFLMVAFFMAVHSIGRLKTEGKAHRTKLRDNTGQVSFWAKRIHKTAPGGYFQRDNARLLGLMAVGMLNLQGHNKLKKPAAQLVAEAPDIPDDIKAYFLDGLEFGTAGIPKLRLKRRFLMWLGYKKTGPLDLDPERVVEFIETNSE